ncbi:MAG: hypothetical protein JW836_16160, partial [Deltaproteobacteria bacterium]|nr:hypothetical protein [Deltaproteobacteria bacterium]
MQIDKTIITNMGALGEKYGSNLTRIKKAVERLLAADKKRGLEAKVVAVDSIDDMEAVKGRVVTDKGDQRQVKAAVDAVYRAYRPDYMMIIGAPDIVPHQDLKNPLYNPRGDEDRVIPSDLPYACDAPFSSDPSKFLVSCLINCVSVFGNITFDNDMSFLRGSG